MTWDLVLMLCYRALALAVALAMAWTIVTARDVRTQLFAALVFVPFLLRSLGLK